MDAADAICAAISQANQGAGEGIAGAKTETDQSGSITKAVNPVIDDGNSPADIRD